MDKKEFNKSTIHNLNLSISYSPDAVVSKTVLNKKTGTVTLFSFDKGQGLSEHTAPFDALVQIVDGNAVIIIDKKEYELKAGEFIVMPASIPHALQARESFKMLLTMIKSE